MKIIRLAIVSAVGLSILFGGFYLKVFSSLESEIDAYIVQVGIYKQEENANEMINQLTNFKTTKLQISKR